MGYSRPDMSEGEIRNARGLLTALIHLSDNSRHEIDELLSEHPSPGGRRSTDGGALPYEYILGVLEAIHIPPDEFFRALFPKPEDRGPAEGSVLARYLDALDESGVPHTQPPLPLPANAPVESTDFADLERDVHSAVTEALGKLRSGSKPGPR